MARRVDLDAVEKSLCPSGKLIPISASSLLLNNVISDMFECRKFGGAKKQIKS
jgi:hypothetical protein